MPLNTNLQLTRTVKAIKQLTIEKVETQKQLEEVHSIREIVFIEEQNVPRDREYDEFEDKSTHFLARIDRQAVGCGRIRPYGESIKIERLAVLKDHRNRGIGTSIMRKLEEEALKSDPEELILHSQVTAVDFYRSCGYRERGKLFLDAGIDHIEMFREVRK
jgi:predicted GNAT family N-acyltransferase